MNQHKPLAQRTASLFRNGRNQAVRIPVEFELPGTAVLISKDGDRLIIEPKREKPDFLALLASFKPLGPDDQFPDIDDDHLPLREIDLEPSQGDARYQYRLGRDAGGRKATAAA